MGLAEACAISRSSHTSTVDTAKAPAFRKLIYQLRLVVMSKGNTDYVGYSGKVSVAFMANYQFHVRTALG